MNFKLIYIIVLLFTSLFSNGQKKGVLAENIKSKKSVLIKENTFIRITLMNDKKIWGRFKINNESSLASKTDTVYLGNIYEIKRLTIGGFIFKTIGGVIAVGFLALAIETSSGNFSNPISDGFAIVGGLTFWGMYKLGSSVDKNYMNENWDFYITQ